MIRFVTCLMVPAWMLAASPQPRESAPVAAQGWTCGFEDREAGPSGDWLTPAPAHRSWFVRPDQGHNHVLSQEGLHPSFSIALVEGQVVGDLSLSALLQGSGGRRVQGLVWRYQDEKNFFLIRAEGGEPGSKVVPEISVDLHYRGKRIPLGGKSRVSGLDVSKWFRLKVEHQGPLIRMFLGDDKVAELHDEYWCRLLPEKGRAGIYTLRQTTARFDNVAAKPLPPLRLSAGLRLNLEEQPTGRTPGFLRSPPAPATAWLVRQEGDGTKVLAQESEADVESLAILRASSMPADVSLAARMKSLSGRRIQGVIWRHRDDSNYFVARTGGDDDGADIPEIRVDLYYRGKRVPLGGNQKVPGLDVGQWHSIRVEHRGPSIRLYHGERVAAEIRDEYWCRMLEGDGGVGLFTKGTTARFGEFTAAPLPASGGKEIAAAAK